MWKSRRYQIPKQVWVCPHCGHEHKAADLLRLDGDTFQCKPCGKPFPDGKAESR